MKHGVRAQVSMECEYQEGECSICAPETDRVVGEVIAVTSGVVRFKLFV